MLKANGDSVAPRAIAENIVDNLSKSDLIAKVRNIVDN